MRLPTNILWNWLFLHFYFQPLSSKKATLKMALSVSLRACLITTFTFFFDPIELLVQVRHFGCDKEGFRSIILQRFKNYRIYLDLLISELCNRFEPWPEWVVLSEKCFNFMNNYEFEVRNDSFSKLLDEPHDINPLLPDEKQRLQAEYVTLHRNALTVLEHFKQCEEEN